MLNNYNKRNIVAIVLSFYITPVMADHSHHIQGESFGDPDSAKVVMDDSWMDKAIQYDEKAGDADITISLGQQTHPALHKVISEMVARKGLKIHIQQGTCGVTSRRLREKSIDIGTFCCPPGKNDRLPGLKFHTLAISPIAFVTHNENPITNLTAHDARMIFQGEYTYWSDLPSSNNPALAQIKQPIKPVVRLHCKKRPGHWRLLLKNDKDFSARATEVGVIPDMIQQVATNQSSIGYETPYMLEFHKDQGELKILTVNGIDPRNHETMLNNKYPFYRTYNMTTWVNDKNKNSHAEELVTEIMQYVEQHGAKYGFIPASQLRKAGWKFTENELSGEPDGSQLVSEH